MNSFTKFLYNNIFGRLMLKIFTSAFFSNLAALYLKSRLSKHKIKKYIKKFNIDMNEYEEAKYRSFNDFFIRRIKVESRPFDMNPESLIAVADSKLSVYKINEDSIFNIKDITYSVSDLIKDEELAKEYLNGLCLIFRLSVENYHRYSYLDNGYLGKTEKIKGVLHTVQSIATDRRKVFAENSREYAVLHTENFKEVIHIEVGAMIVGKIKNSLKQDFKKGEEKGYFEFGGSTVVLLLKSDVADINSDILESSVNNIETVVKLGEKIGKKH